MFEDFFAIIQLVKGDGYLQVDLLLLFAGFCFVAWTWLAPPSFPPKEPRE